MLSIERIYSRELIRSPSVEERKPGLNPMTREDVLDIIAQVQGKYPVGDLVLRAIVNDCSESRQKLQWQVFDWLTKQHPNCGVMVAAAMSVVAVEEVTGLHICSSCKGTGRVRRGCHAGKDCSRCGGTGRVNLMLNDGLVFTVIRLQLDGLALTAQEFHKQHYDQYMGAVNFLHVERGCAAKLCTDIQRRNDSLCVEFCHYAEA
jgi:hypothetical protein